MEQHPDIQPSTEDDRTFALIMHLTLTIGLFTGVAYIAAPIMWLVKRDESPFIDRHGCEVTNVILSGLIYSAIGTLIIFFTLGLGGLLVIPLLVIMPIIAGIYGVINGLAAKESRFRKYPAIFRFLKPRDSAYDLESVPFVPHI